MDIVILFQQNQNLERKVVFTASLLHAFSQKMYSSTFWLLFKAASSCYKVNSNK